MTDASAPSPETGPGDAAVEAALVRTADGGAIAAVAPLTQDAVTGLPQRRRRHRISLFLVAFLLGLVSVLGVTAAALAAWDARYDAKVLPGVHVGSIDLSGLDRAAATEALTAGLDYGTGQLVLRAPSGDLTIPYRAFSRRANVGALVDAALAAGRGGTLPDRIAGEVGQAMHGVDLAPAVELDQTALSASVTTALAGLAAAPVDATVSVASGHYLTTPAVAGQSVDPAPVIAAALAGVRVVDAPAELVVPVAVTPLPPAVSDGAIRAAVFRAGMVSSANLTISFGKKTWVLKAGLIRGWVGFATADDGSIQPTVDTAGIAKSLSQVAKAVLAPAKSAVFLRSKSGAVVGVAASADGRQLDVAATSQRIAVALLARVPSSQTAAGTAAPPRVVKVAMAPVAPRLTTEQAKLKAPVLTLLGTWTTWFPISDHNFYGANIWIPARIINGTLLAPGQTFDWWNTVGDVSTARGFGPGGVILGNHTDPTGALGGGMCSSSTTLFNAALRAGLRMGARGNHRYYINRYPLGLDATVWKMGGAVQDMSFTNDTGHPILILGLKSVGSGGRGYVTYQLWGTPDGRRVSLSGPQVSNVIQATTNTEYVSTLPHGVRQQTEYPSNQMDVSVTRVVRDRSGRIIHDDVWQSHYVLWNGIIQIGR